jgi:UDP-N-acetylmuramate dehydrogenase
VKETVERGFCGLENLSYIPGTVGASPVQNIGAYGVELADVFVSCEVFDCEDMKQKTFSKEECRFGYRDSIFKQEKNRYCIMSVTLLLNREKKFTLTYNPLNRLAEQEGLTVSQVREEVIKIRKEKLPDWKEHPNCGSFFKNPIIDEETSKKLLANHETAPLIRTDDGLKVSSAWLIDHVAHMKGVRRGSLYTWPKQPLVIVNDGNATADDVDAFAKEIAGSVFEKTGIVLEQEVNRVG